MGNKTTGYCFILLSVLGGLFTGLLGLAFVVLAVYLVVSDIGAGLFRARSLMMPVMNVLISSMLFFYSRQLFLKGGVLKKQVEAGTFVPPPLRPTPYDLLGIFGFLALVALVCCLIFF